MQKTPKPTQCQPNFTHSSQVLLIRLQVCAALHTVIRDRALLTSLSKASLTCIWLCGHVSEISTSVYTYAHLKQRWPSLSSQNVRIRALEASFNMFCCGISAPTMCHGDSVSIKYLVRSSLTNLRCYGSPCGRGLGEVGQLIYSDLPLTHSTYVVPNGHAWLL